MHGCMLPFKQNSTWLSTAGAQQHHRQTGSPQCGLLSIFEDGPDPGSSMCMPVRPRGIQPLCSSVRRWVLLHSGNARLHRPEINSREGHIPFEVWPAPSLCPQPRRLGHIISLTCRQRASFQQASSCQPMRTRSSLLASRCVLSCWAQAIYLTAQ